jgi:hypothetical protein
MKFSRDFYYPKDARAQVYGEAETFRAAVAAAKLEAEDIAVDWERMGSAATVAFAADVDGRALSEAEFHEWRS